MSKQSQMVVPEKILPEWALQVLRGGKQLMFRRFAV